MKFKKREAENITQSGKRSRSFNEDNGRNPAKTRLDDLTSAEIAGLLKIAHAEDIDLFLNHPRVKEYPFYGNLISYLIGQIKEIQERKSPNLYQSDRFTGLTTFLTNVTSLFYPEPARGLEQLPHFLHSVEELNRRLVAMTVEYFLKELPDENDASSDVVNGDSPHEPSTLEQKLAQNVFNLLTVLHHFMLFESRLPSNERYLKQALFACPAIKIFVARSLDLVDMPGMASSKVGSSGADGVSPTVPVKRFKSNTRLFNKLMDVWVQLLTSSDQAEMGRTLRKQFVKHRNLHTVLNQAVTRLTRRDRTADQSLLLLDALFNSSTLLQQVAVKSGLASVRLALVREALNEFSRIKSTADPRMLQMLHVLSRVVTRVEVRDVVLCGDVADRTLFLDGVNALMTTAFDRLCPNRHAEFSSGGAPGAEAAAVAATTTGGGGGGGGAGSSPKSADTPPPSASGAATDDSAAGSPPAQGPAAPQAAAEDGEAAAGGCAAAGAGVRAEAGEWGPAAGEEATRRQYATAVYRLYARLARGDPRVLASALFGKFGGTATGRERLLLHLQRVRHAPMVPGPDDAVARADRAAFDGIIAALEDRDGLSSYLGPGRDGKTSSRDVRQALQSLQDSDVRMAEEKLNINDSDVFERGLSLVRNGQCVLVQGEQRFKLTDLHIDWLRRTGGGSEPCPFVMLRRNVYLHRKNSSLDPDKVEVCNCLHRPGLTTGCEEDTCSMRLTRVECTPSFCPCGDACSNQRFQKCQYAPLQVCKADDRGWGLYTQGRVAKGTFIIEYMGEVLNRKLYERRKKQYEAERHTYFMALRADPFEMIDASRKSSMARFINHSCEPNCETVKWISLGEVVVGIFALRDLEPGEEVTFDYRMTDGSVGKVCRCGAPSCRGFLGSGDRDKDGL